MIAGSDIGNGLASSLTVRLSVSLKARQQGAPGRVGQGGEHAVERMRLDS